MKHPRTRAERRAALEASKARALVVFSRLGFSPAQAVRRAETPRPCSCALCSPRKAGMTHPRDMRAPSFDFAAL